MKWSSVKAILRQEIYVTRASWEVLFDIFIFTLANIVLFGFIANYLARGSSGSSKLQIESLVIAVVFWEVLRINQYSTSVSSMWNVWSHNLSNMFIAPIKVTEYLAAHIIMATVKSMFILITSTLLVRYVFHISLLSLGLGPLLFAYLNMVIFATAIGLILIGLVFQFGTKVQALTWGTIFMLQPFCAVYFPVSVLPVFLQPIAYFLPATYFFEWLRDLHDKTNFNSYLLIFGFIFNIVYLAAGCYIFSRQLASAKRSGQLARNDL
jgi:ABC-2 type transport system permease protein